LGERKKLEVLLASVKESEKKKKESENSEKKRERERPRHAGESYFEEGRKTEKELRRDREKGKVRSKQMNTQERGKDREYDVTQATHISTQWYAVTTRLSLPVQIQRHHTCLTVGKRNTFWVGDSVGETWLWCLTLVSELQEAHCSTAFLSISKALPHDSAVTNLKMHHWIDTEYRKPQMGTQCQRNQRMQGRILTPCFKCSARNY